MAEPKDNQEVIQSLVAKSVEQDRQIAETSSRLKLNQISLTNLNKSLSNISIQVGNLSASLRGIGNQIKESSIIDSLKEQQKARQEAILAEQQIREGKESQVEKKIQAALVTPIQKIGAKAQGTLFNLGRFFTILLGGFLTNKIIKSISELSGEGKLSFMNFFDKIKKDLAIVGTIYLGINGGLTKILSVLVRLGGLIGRIAFRQLLRRPFLLIFGLLGGVLTSVVGKLKNINLGNIKPSAVTSMATAATAGAGAAATTKGDKPKPKPTTSTGAPGAGVAPTTKPTAPTKTPTTRPTSTRAPGARAAGPIAAFLNFISGGSVGESFTAGFLSALPSLMRFGGLPGIAASFTLPFFAPNLYNLVKPKVESYIPQLGITKDELFKQLSSSTKNNQPKVSVVNVNEGQNEQQNVAATGGEATYLPSISSANSTNFYLMYSQIQYNVVG